MVNPIVNILSNPRLFSKVSAHFPLPSTAYRNSTFFASSSTLAIICTFYNSHVREYEVISWHLPSASTRPESRATVAAGPQHPPEKTSRWRSGVRHSALGKLAEQVFGEWDNFRRVFYELNSSIPSHLENDYNLTWRHLLLLISSKLHKTSSELL